MLVVAACVTFAAEDGAQDVLERVKKRYDAIDDAQLRFSQKTRFELSKVEQNVSGTLWMKKNNRYRVETGDQTIVTDGVTVWSYSAANNQVLIDRFKMDENSISPERILMHSPTEYTPSILGKDKIGKTDVLVLKLVPRNDQSMIKTMKVWVDNATWLIKKVEILDVNGKQTEYLITDLHINSGVKDSLFTYQIPEGVEVVDLR